MSKSFFHFFQKIVFYTIAIGNVFLFNSCLSDKPEQLPKPQVISGGKGVFITCEGNFMAGNASLSYYDKEKRIVIEDIYRDINNEAVGDVLQSMAMDASQFWLIVNNSGKAIAIDKQSLKKQGEITGLTSPRYMIFLSKNKAYISDLYQNSISIVNPLSWQKTGQIELPGWSEAMIYSNGWVYVCNYYRNYLYKIDPLNDLVTDSIPVSYGANSIAEDYNGRLWVACSGNNQIPGKIFCINPFNKNVEKTLVFPANKRPHHIMTDPSGKFVFYLSEDLWKMAVDDNNLPAQPFITSDGRNFYSFSVDPYTDEIYLGDAGNYVEKGKIFRYDKTGLPIDTFQTGVIPGNIYFE